MLRAAYVEHTTELAAKTAAWALPPENCQENDPLVFTDADFDVAASVGNRHAGPDAASLYGGGMVYTTNAPILEPYECAYLIADADETMASGTAPGRFTYGGAVRDVHVEDCHAFARGWLQRKLRSTFFPLIASRYGLDQHRLAVSNALVVGYDAARNATRLPAHRDAALCTINVALSDEAEYEGGGTLIEASQQVVSLPRGHAACHASGLRHAGNPITAGTRWVRLRGSQSP